MISLIRGEIFKFVKNQKNFYVMLLLVIFLFCFYGYNVSLANNYRFNRSQTLSTDISIASGMLQSIELSIDGEIPSHLRDEVDFWTKEAALATGLRARYNFYQEESWKDILNFEIQRVNNLIVGYRQGYKIDVKKTAEEIITDLQRDIDLYEYFLNHDVKPYETPYEQNGLNYMYLLLQGFIPLVFLFFVFMLSGDIYASELENGSYKFQYTLSYGRTRIFFSKAIQATFSSIFSIMIIIATFIVIISFINGWGDVNYPVIVSSGILNIDNNLPINEMIPLWKFVSTCLILLTAVMVFLNILVIFVSLLTDSLSLTFSIIIGLILMTYIFDALLQINFIKTYWVLSYYSVASLLRENGINLINQRVILTCLGSLVLLCISYMLMRKKNFVGGKD